MAFKMKHLMDATGESKSTILFYVKEGLLPEPQKPKPNLHLYDESCIDIIKFIKYLQNQYSYSIAQIQGIFKDKNFTFSDDFSMMLHSLQLMGGSPDGKCYSEEEFLAQSQLTQEKLDEYLERGYLFRQEQGFLSQDLKMAEILKRAELFGLNRELFDAYVASAKSMAVLEYRLGLEMMNGDKSKNSEHYELMFDAILSYKPYLLNGYTMKEYQHKMDEKNEKSI